MFGFLCALTYSFNLTSKDVPFLFGSLEHNPFMAVLVSDWCPHCILHQELFDKLEEKYADDDRFSLVRVNCDNFQKICQSFPDTSTPGLYWVHSTPDKAEGYYGVIDFGNVVSFIEKHAGQTILNVQTNEEYKQLLKDYDENSIFVYQKSEENDVTPLIVDIAQYFRNYPCLFAILNFTLDSSTKSNVLFNIAPSFKSTNKFTGNFNKDNLESFINKFVFPPISPVSALFFDHAKNNNYTVLLLADEEPSFKDGFTSMILENNMEMRATHLKCEFVRNLCLQLMIKIGFGPQVIMYNPNKNFNWYYKDDLVANDIIEWINKVQNGKIRAAGAGGGFIGFIMNLADDFRRKGIAALALFVSIFAVFIMIFVIGCAQSVYDRRRRMLYRKLQ